MRPFVPSYEFRVKFLSEIKIKFLMTNQEIFCVVFSTISSV
jgi:hypothetical protein